MSETLHIIAAVVDTQRLTLYKQDGTTLVIPQGDVRLRALVDKVVPALESTGSCLLTDEDLQLPNSFVQAEQQMNGFVRFFRTFKSTMESLLEQFAGLDVSGDPQTPAAPVEPLAVGQLPAEAPSSKAQSAVAEILANAVPASAPEFREPLQEEETVVAVLHTGEVIPGVEKLDVQLQAMAAKLGRAEGVKNFFSRLATVNRRHSVQDLLTFMQKGELPLADDGSVLVYKRLKPTNDPQVFVDCHSGNVRQRVGSHVFMDEKLVDPDRHQECSNGLHVARRDYLRSFEGSVCVLAKLAPEDVIAVPHSDARKLRAKGYHIIARLSDEDAKRVCNNQPMKDIILLGNAVAGNHVGILETVEIRGHKGTDLVITPMGAAPEIALEEQHQAQSLDALPSQNAEAAKVDAAALAGQVIAGRQSGRQQQAQALLDKVLNAKDQPNLIEAAKALVAFKKAAKVGWDKLGISPAEAQRVLEIAEGPAKPAAAPQPAKPKEKAPDWKPSKESPRERIQALLQKPLTPQTAAAILKIKKEAKKGWDKLGVSDTQVASLIELAG